MGPKGTFKQASVKLSANWTVPARYGWTLSSEPNTFSTGALEMSRCGGGEHSGVRGEGEM
jgi:hypothetical protein